MNHRTPLTTFAFVILLSVLLMLPPTAHAQSSAPLPNMPTANGTVWVIVPDGAGGVYIGGAFTQLTPASGPAVTRNCIARINADGTIHPWNPNADNQVLALAVSGSTVYAGGNFLNIGGQPRNYIAALDATTGNAIIAWAPTANFAVNALAVSGSTVYASGDFTTIGGQARNRIAALNNTNGGATAWDPDADGNVRALAVSGSTVYAGGSFTNIGGQARSRIAALDAAGAATTWNPYADPGEVNALAVCGSTVYAGGHFRNIGGQARNFIAALDATINTNNATAWNPNANRFVPALAMSGSTVYAGGDFTSIGGQARDRIAALDVTTGNATAWNPSLNSFVYALAVSGSTVYAGGDFTIIGVQARPYFAAFGAPYLSNLMLSSGTLSPAFAWNTYAYSASVTICAPSITVTPTTPDATAVIRVNSTVVASGAASGVIPLAVGANTITITITTWDGIVTTYTLTVTRAAAANGGQPVKPAEVPEADTLLLLGGGMSGLGVWARWQWSKRGQRTKAN